MKTINSIELLIRKNLRSAPVIKKLTNQVVGIIDVRDVVKYLIFHLSLYQEEYISKSQELNKRQLSLRLFKMSENERKHDTTLIECLKSLFCIKKDNNEHEHDDIESLDNNFVLKSPSPSQM